MPAYFEEGFVVRVPAWHKLGKVFEDYPGRDEAFIAAGHDFEVVECTNGDVIRRVPERDLPYILQDDSKQVVRVDGEWHYFDRRPDEKGLRIEQLRDGVPGPVHGKRLKVQNKSYTVVQNETPWGILDTIMSDSRFTSEAKIRYETGGTLDGGAQCFVTCVIDKPFQVKGDDSRVLPYIAINWRHDGLGAVKVLSTSVREVCANTVHAAEAEAEGLGRLFTFKHTKNVHERIEDAKMTLLGITAAHEEFEHLANELASILITEEQKREFVVRFTTPTEVLNNALVSKTVQQNVANAQAAVNGVFNSRTIPDAHQFTGWGLYNAAVEYLDHLRPSRGGSDITGRSDSYVRRTLLTPTKAKAQIVPLIKDVAGVS